MKSRTTLCLLVLLASLAPNLPAAAQTPASHPSSGGVAAHFKSGANRVGHGAEQIGEAIWQGAIMTWQAMKDGAAAVVARFNGGHAAAPTHPGPSTGKSP